MLRDRSSWKVPSTELDWVYAFVPPDGAAELTMQVGDHGCAPFPVASISDDLARLPRVGTMLMFHDGSSCLQSWNLTFVFDSIARPPALVAALYDQFEW